MRVVLYREVDGRLIRHQVETVADSSTDPEGAAWSAATRRTGSAALPEGRFVLHREGKRYRREQQTQWSNAQIGTAA